MRFDSELAEDMKELLGRLWRLY